VNTCLLHEHVYTCDCYTSESEFLCFLFFHLGKGARSSGWSSFCITFLSPYYYTPGKNFPFVSEKYYRSEIKKKKLYYINILKDRRTVAQKYIFLTSDNFWSPWHDSGHIWRLGDRPFQALIIEHTFVNTIIQGYLENVKV